MPRTTPDWSREDIVQANAPGNARLTRGWADRPIIPAEELGVPIPMMSGPVLAELEARYFTINGTKCVVSIQAIERVTFDLGVKIVITPIGGAQCGRAFTIMSLQVYVIPDKLVLHRHNWPQPLICNCSKVKDWYRVREINVDRPL